MHSIALTLNMVFSRKNKLLELFKMKMQIIKKPAYFETFVFYLTIVTLFRAGEICSKTLWMCNQFDWKESESDRLCSNSKQLIAFHVLNLSVSQQQHRNRTSSNWFRMFCSLEWNHNGNKCIKLWNNEHSISPWPWWNNPENISLSWSSQPEELQVCQHWMVSLHPQ